jgi:hypothetical protein
MGQSDAAREYSFGQKSENLFRAATAAMQLADFIGANGCDECWANDPDFDIVILRNWWKRLPMTMLPFPISYRAHRSFRTIKALAAEFNIQLPEASGTAHNPVDDAAHQARVVIAARCRMFNLRAVGQEAWTHRPGNGHVTPQNT